MFYAAPRRHAPFTPAAPRVTVRFFATPAQPPEATLLPFRHAATAYRPTPTADAACHARRRSTLTSDIAARTTKTLYGTQPPCRPPYVRRRPPLNAY